MLNYQRVTKLSLEYVWVTVPKPLADSGKTMKTRLRSRPLYQGFEARSSFASLALLGCGQKVRMVPVI